MRGSEVITSARFVPNSQHGNRRDNPVVDCHGLKPRVAKSWPWECASPELVRRLRIAARGLRKSDPASAEHLSKVARSLRRSLAGAVLLAAASLLMPRANAQRFQSSPSSPTLLDYSEFAAITAAHAADWASTEQFRRRGDHEVILNDGFVDHKATFALYSAALVGVDIWANLALRRRHHVILSRLGTLIDIGGTAMIAVHNYQLKPAPGDHSFPVPFGERNFR